VLVEQRCGGGEGKRGETRGGEKKRRGRGEERRGVEWRGDREGVQVSPPDGTSL